MASPHEHIEHAEHAEHAHDPFDKRVAVSIAIVAAVLAGISMLGHRKHNEVLQLQGDSNRLQTEANVLHTRASDTWGEYQAVNLRDHGYDFAGGVLKEVAKAEPKYADGLQRFIKKADDQHGKYEARLKKLDGDAKALTKSAEDRQVESSQFQHRSHYAHHQADRLDYAHLGAELGIVLCSLALLTKRRAFWLAGVLSVVLAIGIAVSAYLIPHDDPTHDAHPTAAEAEHPH